MDGVRPEFRVTLVEKIGKGVAACPDTGNWKDNATRYAGLKATFPIAVSCDFKARAISPDGSHPLYDLKRCFSIGWQAGYRGPWCLEHANADRKALFRELALLRDQLRGWMKGQTLKTEASPFLTEVGQLVSPWWNLSHAFRTQAVTFTWARCVSSPRLSDETSAASFPCLSSGYPPVGTSLRRSASP